VQVARQDVEYWGNDDPKWMKHWLGASNMKWFNFGYDSRHQLTSVSETALPNAFSATYTYGNAGRFATAVEAAAALPNSDVTPRNVTYIYSSSDPERITALRKNPGTKNLATYTWDDSGNQLNRTYPDSKDSWDYVYDGKNQLRRVTKKNNGVVQGSEEYWYDGDNRRYLTVKRDASGVKTGAIWFIRDTEAHYNAAGTVTRAFGHVTMGTPVARTDRSSDGPSTLEYQFHGVASNTIATVDQVSGTINASFTYAPFGKVIEATNDGGASTGLAMHKRRFNDKFVDDVSGLAYYGYRYYDKLSMTWTQSDPLFVVVPDLAKGGSPRRANLHGFSLNNPLRYVDPDGQDATNTVGPCRGPAGSVCQGKQDPGIDDEITPTVPTDMGTGTDDAPDASLDDLWLPDDLVRMAGPYSTLARTGAVIDPRYPGSTDAAKARVAGTVTGVVLVGSFFGASRLWGWLTGGASKSVSTAANGALNPKIYSNLEGQLARDGARSIFKSLRTAERTLAHHQAKLPGLQYKSQVERTIRNVKDQIYTIEKFIKDKGLL
jgi:RHS repeat-associated protein